MAKPSKETAKSKKSDGFFRKFLNGAKKRYFNFMSKRVHRTLRRTLRRDYARPLNLPGYAAFTIYVWRVLWQNKKHFSVLMLVLFLMYVVLVGLGSQSTYSTLLDFLKESGNNVVEGDVGGVTQALTALLTISTVGFGGEVSEAAQIYSVLVLSFGWLAIVWILRSILAKKNFKVRDAIYNAGAPIVSIIVLLLVLAVQMIPIALAVVGYVSAQASGLLAGGVEAMLFWVAAGALSLVSIYWSVSTFFALILVSLPGTYPFKALSIAGDIMYGRRSKFVLRLVWLLFITAAMWLMTLIPIILFDMWLKDTWSAINWLPLVPFAVASLTIFALVWVCSYIYLLYRKVIAEDAKNV